MTAEQIARNLALVDALESGKYEQGHGCLRNGNKFCCIGVACNLVDPERWKPIPLKGGSSVYVLQHGERFVAPQYIRDLYGWSSHNPALPGFEFAPDCRAASLNDSGIPFSTIATGFRRLAAQGGEK